MIDGYGRNIDYMRISVTDRCNLRCVYCMPEEGIQPVSHQDILSYDEIRILAEIFAGLGIRKIKVTGGEPLVRRNLSELVKLLKDTPGIETVTLTTNGVLLAEQMEALAQAGVDGINLSLDTLDSEAFAAVARRKELERVMRGFYRALEYPEIPLKINCVPLRVPGQNLAELAELARIHPVHVRFIEMMPMGFGKQFATVPEQEILEELAEHFGEYEPFRERLGNGPAHYYAFQGFRGKIGFISALSHKFCGQCNRVRLTSQGFLKTCLQYESGVNLRALLRAGVGRGEIERAVSEAIRSKPAEHRFGDKSVENREEKMMSQIGG